MQLELSDTIVKENSVGSFNNYVDKKGLVGGQPNVYVCQHGVGG